MEEKTSEILENILSLLSLEGSFEVEEKSEGVFVSIDLAESGLLIGRGGETLSALQLIINLIVSRQMGDQSQRVIIDVSGWRRSKEEELAHKARGWAQKVLDTKEPMELSAPNPWLYVPALPLCF